MKQLVCKEYVLSLDKPLLMGVLNVTPDSFSDGGEYVTVEKAVAHAQQMITQGVDIIDIGGESTRPGAAKVSVEEELSRVLPVVEALKNCGVPLSIDTQKWEVADACFKAGAHILNDVSGLRDEKMVAIAAKYQVPVVIMHMLGTPQNMQDKPEYHDVVAEVKEYLLKQARMAQQAGINQIVVDPGIGFGKSVNDNFRLLSSLDEFVALGYPVLVGVSRKSFIGKTLDLPVSERLEGTLAAVSACVLKGAHILRVHDVKECKRAVEIALRIRES